MAIQVAAPILDPLKHLLACHERVLRGQLRRQFADNAEFENAIANNSVLRDARESIRLLEGQ